MSGMIHQVASAVFCAAMPVAMLAGIVFGQTAQAQTRGCVTTTRTEPPPPRQVLSCGDGLTITMEPGAALRLTDRNRDGKPDRATLDDKAALIEVRPGRGGFQVQTPHAIAAVRGTVWAVDVSAGRTSVYVERGRVAVRGPKGRSVTLSAGDGVDVTLGAGTLVVSRWGAARVSALLARFGR